MPVQLRSLQSMYQMCGTDVVYFIQKNSLNKRKRMLSIEATNETFNNRVKIKEECSYKVSYVFTFRQHA